MINTDFDKSIFVDVCSGPVVRDLSHYPAGPPGAAEALSKKNVLTSSYFCREALATNIDHEECSLKAKSVQALRSNIDHETHAPLKLRSRSTVSLETKSFQTPNRKSILKLPHPCDLSFPFPVVDSKLNAVAPLAQVVLFTRSCTNIP